MIDKIRNVFSIPELRKRILFTLGVLVVVRLGAHVPIPGVNGDALRAAFETMQNTLFGLFDMFAGGAFQKATLFALGIMPYISASIMIQLMGTVVPYFQRLQKEGEAGRKKITQITRYVTVLIATLQAYSVTVFLESMTASSSAGVVSVVVNPGLGFKFVAVVTIVTGTMLLMWLGERITERGIGNGISLIIMIGIMSRLPTVIISEVALIYEGVRNLLSEFILLGIMFVIIAFVVYLTQGTRKIPVQYAKRVVGRKVYGGQATHIPLKILTAGVMPIIFAQALMFLPSTMASFFPQGSGFGDWLQRVFSPTHLVYSLFFAFLIIIFTYFYTAIAFNPVDVADNMKKQGGFIPGVRPGKSTSDYIDHILTRVTLPASIFLALIAVFPTFLSGAFDVDFSLASFYGGTSLLITAGAALDTLQQIESHLLMRHYDGFLKTGKLKGRNRTR